MKLAIVATRPLRSGQLINSTAERLRCGVSGKAQSSSRKREMKRSVPPLVFAIQKFPGASTEGNLPWASELQLSPKLRGAELCLDTQTHIIMCTAQVIHTFPELPRTRFCGQPESSCSS